MQTSRFLTAKWSAIVMINYEVDGALLLPFVPKGVELDSWDGKTFVSMVGFLFSGTRVFGVPIPFHREFEEVNLRFYVRKHAIEGDRRGVVFIKEIVPKPAVALIARFVYGEKYVSMPMRHLYTTDGLLNIRGNIKVDGIISAQKPGTIRNHCLPVHRKNLSLNTTGDIHHERTAAAQLTVWTTLHGVSRR